MIIPAIADSNWTVYKRIFYRYQQIKFSFTMKYLLKKLEKRTGYGNTVVRKRKQHF